MSAALLQGVLRSNLPEAYKSLSHSTYTLPSKDGISNADWESIMDAYVAASRAVFILQVPLIGACLLLCAFVRDRGLERPKDPDEKAPSDQHQRRESQPAKEPTSQQPEAEHAKTNGNPARI